MKKRYLFELRAEITTPLEVDADSLAEAKQLVLERSERVEYFDNLCRKPILVLVRCLDE